jgi:hypothetical protein
MPEIKDKTSIMYRKPPETLELFQKFIIKIRSKSYVNIIVIDSLNQLFSITKASDDSIKQFLKFSTTMNDKYSEEEIDTIILFYTKKHIDGGHVEEIIQMNENIQLERIEGKNGMEVE